MVDTSAVSGGLVPAIRFKGFSGEWNKKKLKEVSSYSNGGSFEEYARDDGSYELVTLKSVNMNGELVSSCRYVNIETPTLPKGTLVMILSEQSPGLLGMTACIPKNGFYVLNQRVAEIRPNSLVDSLFLSKAINRNQDYFSQRGAGTKVQNISKPNVENFELLVAELKEQTQIGQYFQKLDTLIVQHQQKHEKLLNLKKSLLEKMFPEQGADEPAIRFNGFSGAWVASELGEILDITSAARVHKDEWTNRGVPFFRTSDVVAEHKSLENKKAFISFELYDELSSKIGCVKKDDLLITGGGSIGIPYLIKTNSPLYFKDADLLWIKNNSKINGYFLFIFFFSQVFRKYIGSITHIGTISHYTIEQAKSTPINVPNDEEQAKIGNFFQQLDTLITQHQTQLKKLTNIKQACLAKLFV